MQPSKSAKTADFGVKQLVASLVLLLICGAGLLVGYNKLTSPPTATCGGVRMSPGAECVVTEVQPGENTGRTETYEDRLRGARFWDRIWGWASIGVAGLLALGAIIRLIEDLVSALRRRSAPTDPRGP